MGLFLFNLCVFATLRENSFFFLFVPFVTFCSILFSTQAPTGLVAASLRRAHPWSSSFTVFGLRIWCPKTSVVASQSNIRYLLYPPNSRDKP